MLKRWTLFIAALLCVCTVPAHAALYWEDEMEVFPASGGGSMTSFGPLISGAHTMDTNIKLSGTGSLRYNYPELCQTVGPGQVCGGATARFFPQTNEHYGRLYFRVSQDFEWGAVNGQSKLWGMRSTTGNSKLWFNFYFGLGMIISAENTPQDGSTTNIPINITMPRSQWVCIEWHFIANTPGVPNGVLETWMNGTLTKSASNIQWRGATNSSAWDFISMYRQSGFGNLWFDRVAVGTTRIGCGGAVPTDTTNPTQPVISVSSPTTNSVLLTVTTPSTDNAMASYVIRRCTGSGCTPSTTHTTISSSLTSYTDNTASPGTLYRYTAAGVDTSGNQGAQSAIKEVTTGSSGSGSTITLDATSNSATANTTNSVTWNHTVGTGTGRVLAVCAMARDTVAGLANTAVSGITYDGLPLTKIRHDEKTNSGFGSSIRTESWYLIAPASKTGAITVTWTGPLSMYGVGTATSYSGVAAAPLDANGGATGNGTNLSASITTATNNARIHECTIAQDTALTFTAGQTALSNRQTTSSNIDTVASAYFDQGTAGAKTLTGTQVQAFDFAISAAAFKPGVAPTAPPSIAGLTLTSSGGAVTGFDLLYGAVTPTFIRLDLYTNQSTYASIEYPIASFPSGHFTFSPVPPAGVGSMCVFARDAAHVENTISDDYRCTTFGSLVGPIDEQPPLLSNPQPSGTLPSGTTSANISMTVDKPVNCLYSVTNITYGAMLADDDTLVMSGVVPVMSATVAVTSGTNNFYGACRFTDINLVDRDSTTLAIPVQVAASPAADTTAPSTIGGVSTANRGATAVDIFWTTATDNVAVASTDIFLSLDDTNYFLAATIAAPGVTATISGLTPSTLHYVKLRAIDTSNNPSVAFSAPVTFTLDALRDLTQPSTMADLRTTGCFVQGCVLVWTPGTDTGFGSNGSVTSTIEIALSTNGVCGAYDSTYTDITLSTFTANLAGGTSYCARGLHTDGAGNSSADYSNVVTFTTLTAGLNRPRAEARFGVDRGASAIRATANERLERQ